MTYKINNNSNLVFANLGIKEKYVGFYESLTDGDPRLKLFELSKETIIEAVEALIEKKEREVDLMVSDSYEALKLVDEIHHLEIYLMFGEI